MAFKNIPSNKLFQIKETKEFLTFLKGQNFVQFLNPPATSRKADYEKDKDRYYRIDIL